MTDKKTAPLDPQIADRLLDLLSTDDAFRDLFQANPTEALGRLGYLPAAGAAMMPLDQSEQEQAQASLTSCLQVQALASKEVIAEARETIRAMLIAGLAYHSPQLDASTSDDRFTRK